MAECVAGRSDRQAADALAGMTEKELCAMRMAVGPKARACLACLCEELDAADVARSRYYGDPRSKCRTGNGTPEFWRIRLPGTRLRHELR